LPGALHDPENNAWWWIVRIRVEGMGIRVKSSRTTDFKKNDQLGPRERRKILERQAIASDDIWVWGGSFNNKIEPTPGTA